MRVCAMICLFLPLLVTHESTDMMSGPSACNWGSSMLGHVLLQKTSSIRRTTMNTTVPEDFNEVEADAEEEEQAIVEMKSEEHPVSDAVLKTAGHGKVTSMVNVNSYRAPYTVLSIYVYWDLLFIILGLVVYFLMPLALQEPGSNRDGDGASLFPQVLPALQSLRYLAILSVWLKHWWFQNMFLSTDFFLILSGFILEFAEQRRGRSAEDSSMLDKYKEFLPRRFARLYPLYALHVIIGYLSQPGPSKCSPVGALLLYQSWWYGTGTFALDGEGKSHLVYDTCGTGTWFVSVIFGCYFLFPVVSQPLRKISNVVPLWAGAALLVVVPRALASPANAPMVWWDNVFAQQAAPVGAMELLFSQRSLVHGFAHFFLGMVLARAWSVGARSSTEGGFIGSVCTYGCILGLAALAFELYVSMLVDFNVPSRWGVRLAKELWKVVWQSALVLGASGPWDSPTNSLADPARWLLSLPWLSWMGELALPLYLTMHWACSFSDSFVSNSGVSATGSPGVRFVAQLATMHLVALMIYMSCGALHSRRSVSKGDALADQRLAADAARS